MEKEPSKEATLKEVLAEVSLADVGGMLKTWLSTLGCLGIGMAFVLLFTAATQGVGLPDDWGIPGWLVWLVLAWLFVHEATSVRSYHKLDMSWYFPKLGWFGSLLLAAYVVGFIELLFWVNSLDKGVGAGLAFFAVWVF